MAAPPHREVGFFIYMRSTAARQWEKARSKLSKIPPTGRIQPAAGHLTKNDGPLRPVIFSMFVLCCMPLDQFDNLREINSQAANGFKRRDSIFRPAAAFVNCIHQLLVTILAIPAQRKDLIFD